LAALCHLQTDFSKKILQNHTPLCDAAPQRPLDFAVGIAFFDSFALVRLLFSAGNRDQKLDMPFVIIPF
jgi:hypothetical protein